MLGKVALRRWFFPSKNILSAKFHSSSVVQSEFSHVVIGGGVVGVAIAAELSKANSSDSVLLLEQHTKLGTETTARNSEVIHAGLYYPKDSLKTKLCIEGKLSIYDIGDSIELKKCGKWIIAQNEEEGEFLNALYKKATQDIDVPVEFVSLSKAKLEQPLIKASNAILKSPTTGILSADSLVDYLIAKAQENDAEIAVGSKVTGITKNGDHYIIQVDDIMGNSMEITSNNVINAAGLHACNISNMLLPKERNLTPYFAKGNYFSYNSHVKIDTLVYPCPSKSVQSLGTHLTIDLAGQIRFGPDLEWVDSPDEYTVNSSNLERAYVEVKKYLPSIDKDKLVPDYAGIRPKLIGANDKMFQDFIIREEEGFKGFVNLLGIESPGLTASMGIARYVRDIYYR